MRIPLSVLLVSLFSAAYSKDEADYIGLWFGGYEMLEIVKNGESYLAVDSNGEKLALVLEKGILQSPGGVGGTAFTYIEQDDTLLAQGLLGSKVFRRTNLTADQIRQIVEYGAEAIMLVGGRAGDYRSIKGEAPLSIEEIQKVGELGPLEIPERYGNFAQYISPSVSKTSDKSVSITVNLQGDPALEKRFLTEEIRFEYDSVPHSTYHLGCVVHNIPTTFLPRKGYCSEATSK